MSLPAPEPPLKVLVVDDDRATLMLTSRVLERAGYEVISAEDGEQALDLFNRKHPDILLTDFEMPGMDGVELTRHVQARTVGDDEASGHYVAVMIFTAEKDPELLEKSLGAGAIQFLQKPFGPSELRSRVRAMGRLVKLHREIAYRKLLQEQEIGLVKHLMTLMVEQGQRELPEGFWMKTLATRRINGDACCHRMSAPGVHYGCLVDAMGHGLMAAVSAMAVVEIFLTLGPLGHSPAAIYGEMNRKHLHRFPDGRFSCALLFRLDTHMGRLVVLNAGLPLALLVSRDGTVTEIDSESVPLGILEKGGCAGARELDIHPGDRFFACTDGLSELIPPNELMALLLDPALADPNAALQDRVRERIGSGELHDDVSWVLWTVPEQAPVPASPDAVSESGETVFSLRLDFSPRALDYGALGPRLAMFLSSIGVPAAQAQTLALVLAEGLINATEHGLLSLDSHLKNREWETWEAARAESLAREDRQLRLELQIRAASEGAVATPGTVDAWIEDPGAGFDWREALAATGQSQKPHGRGLELIHALAHRVSFNEAGNVLHFTLAAP